MTFAIFAVIPNKSAKAANNILLDGSTGSSALIENTNMSMAERTTNVHIPPIQIIERAILNISISLYLHRNMLRLKLTDF